MKDIKKKNQEPSTLKRITALETAITIAKISPPSTPTDTLKLAQDILTFLYPEYFVTDGGK
jgi:hypothetical protein